VTLDTMTREEFGDVARRMTDLRRASIVPRRGHRWSAGIDGIAHPGVAVTTTATRVTAGCAGSRNRRTADSSPAHAPRHVDVWTVVLRTPLRDPTQRRRDERVRHQVKFHPPLRARGLTRDR